jgi:steroid delta-isomerase-like uncharacterized protein
MQEIKKVVQVYTDALWNQKQISIMDRMVHPDVCVHSPLGAYRGRDALRQVVESWLVGFPDLHVKNEFLVTEGDLVCVQWHANGTHLGEFKGKRPTGKSVKYSGVTNYRVQHGQIVEYWAFLDMQNLLGQI